eukprot:TRINITY_DN15930_c0_g1_i1.p1 TRINITY_DN15930_c0_g1~~TRINITY_DN15930_c0_g1_i1.p1  ORF type:complete len:308 (-),score=98.87 TRINITY_DN15930_c0_g1_i1:5-928(-)
MYEDSIEEQKFKSSIRLEKTAFERLIREKSTMSIPVEQDGKFTISDTVLNDDETILNTRNAGGAPVSKIIDKPGVKPGTKGRILVDFREFRSSLPSLLHKQGFEVVPCHLEIGDYILSPNICIERKSVTTADLFSSFKSGRLYSQVEAMIRNYPIVVLLIEFVEDRPFLLVGQTDIGAEISPASIISKIVMLTQSFPKLRVFWCKSGHVTAELFERVKQGEKEPELVGEGVEEEEGAAGVEGEEGERNMAALDVLKKLPGVNDGNWRRVVERVENLKELSGMALEEMEEMLGAENGRQLFEFFRSER